MGGGRISREEQRACQRRRAVRSAPNSVKPATLTKRRYRAHQKAGGAVPRVPLKDANGAVELLLDLGWLPLSHSEDPRHIGIAAGRLLDDLVAWANGMRRKFGPQWTDHVAFRWSNPEHER